MEPISANTILEEAEKTRKRILATDGFVVPNEIAYIFEEYSNFFENFTFDEWRLKQRHEELIEYVLWRYEYEDGEEGWRQLLVDFWPDKYIQKRRRLLKGLFAGRSEKFWAAVERLKEKPGENSVRMAVAIRKGQLLNVVFEMLASVKDPDGADKAYKEGVYRLLEEILNEEKLPLPKPIKNKIDEDTFWDLISKAEMAAGSSAEFCTNLETQLLAHGAPEISNFRELLYEYFEGLSHYDIWASGYILMNGCSDDSFDYFRMWIISQGKGLYSLALVDLEKFVDKARSIGSYECEGLLSVPENCYFQRSGKRARPKKIKDKISGSPWTEDELPKRYKNLFELVGE